MMAYEYFGIISAISLAVSSVGFLVLKPFFEKKINKITEENEQLKHSMKMFMHWIEKANYMRELADSKENIINILETLKVPDDVLEKDKQILVNYHHSSAMNTINALLALEVINGEQGATLMKTLNTLNVKALSDSYLENLHKSADANNKMSEELKKNSRLIKKLERRNNSYYYWLVICQSFGLIFGIIAFIIKK
jgi:CRISPR/Cas system-associated endonuclease/helicase Cas3